MNVLELFAGIGGIGLGLERAGMTVVGQVEIDPFCQRVLAKHWPNVARHDDVRTCVEWWRTEPRPPVHLVAGGFPCQPVSVAGKGLAQEDERWLWPAFAAVVRALRPRWVLLENVPGLLGRGVGDVLGDLAACGYDAEWDCVPAAAVGAPHLRDRWFCVAYPADAVRRPVGRGLADGEEARGREAARWPVREGLRESGHDGPTAGGATMADAEGNGRQPRRAGDAAQEPGGRQSSRSGGGTPVVFGQRESGGRGLPERQPWWAVEPDVGRVADGVPARVDRLRGLGNAVVPQVGEHVGHLILSVERRAAA